MSEQITKHSDTEIKVTTITPSKSKEEVFDLKKINRELEFIAIQEAEISQRKENFLVLKLEAEKLEVVEKQ